MVPKRYRAVVVVVLACLLVAVTTGAILLHRSSFGTPKSVASTHWTELHWNASTSKVVGYNIYREGRDTPRVKLNSAPVQATEFQDHALSINETYNYYVCAVDMNGQESDAVYISVGPVPAQ